MSIIDTLGDNTSKYRREQRKAIQAMASAMYSPPRVSALAKLCPSLGILLGCALDLTTHDTDGKHWDFDGEEMRDRTWAKVRSEQPLLLIGTPVCTAFRHGSTSTTPRATPRLSRMNMPKASDISVSAASFMLTRLRTAGISCTSTQHRPHRGSRMLSRRS